jgi:hypothetical protein
MNTNEGKSQIASLLITHKKASIADIESLAWRR